MMSKLLVPALAALLLTACGTTERPELSMTDTQISQGAAGPRFVVRGPVVPDDPEPQAVSRKRKSAVAAAGATTSALADKASAAVSAASEAAASAVADALVAPPETPAVAPAPVVETVLPTVTADGAPPVKPNTMSTDIPAMIQSVIGGMPIWLMALIGVVLLAAVALGMSGGRKTSSGV
jgi:hypothetical protein